MLPDQVESPEIPSDAPFENDKLNREPTADFLTDLLSSAEEPYVMSLNAPWGTGKTTFVEMWARKLKNQGYTSLYFNAWENDFADDPLIAFIDAIDELVIEHSGSETSEALKEMGGKLLKRAIPLAIQLGSLGVMDGETRELIAGALAEGSSDLIDAHHQKKDAVDDFKEELETFVNDLSNGKDEYEKDGLLFFFVDELDRCRPDFAVELLERIKHLFNVPGIVFILVTNPNQLRHSIKAMYGQGMNAKGYLRRFVNLDYKLPDPEPGRFAQFLFDHHGLGNFRVAKSRFSSPAGDNDSKLIRAVMAWSCEAFDLKLRAQKQYFVRLALVHHVISKRNAIPLAARAFLAFLIALRRKREELYNDLQHDKSKHKEIDGLINSLAAWETSSGNVDPTILKAALDISYCPDDEQYNSYRRSQSDKIYDVSHGAKKQPSSISRLSTSVTLNKAHSFSTYYEHTKELKNYNIHFEQELIDLIELAAPAQQQ